MAKFYVVRCPGRQAVTADVVLGMRRPAFCTASGRAINISVPTADWKGADAARKLGPTVIEMARAISGASEFRPLTMA